MMKSMKMTKLMKVTLWMNLNVTYAMKYTRVQIHSKNVATIKTVHLKNVVQGVPIKPHDKEF